MDNFQIVTRGANKHAVEFAEDEDGINMLVDGYFILALQDDGTLKLYDLSSVNIGVQKDTKGYVKIGVRA